MFPLTVTMLVSVAPLPVVGPVTVVYEGRTSAPPLPSVMVCAEAKVVDEKVMLPAPAAADAASASRKLHNKSVPVPGVVCGVQLEAVPASSLLTVTT